MTTYRESVEHLADGWIKDVTQAESYCLYLLRAVLRGFLRTAVVSEDVVAPLDATPFDATPFDAVGRAVAPFDNGLLDTFNPIRGAKALSADGNLESRLRSSSLIEAFEILAPAHGLKRRKVRTGMTLSRKSRSFKRRRWASATLDDSGFGVSSSSPAPCVVAFGRCFPAMLFVAY